MTASITPRPLQDLLPFLLGQSIDGTCHFFSVLAGSVPCILRVSYHCIVSKILVATAASSTDHYSPGMFPARDWVCVTSRWRLVLIFLGHLISLLLHVCVGPYIFYFYIFPMVWASWSPAKRRNTAWQSKLPTRSSITTSLYCRQSYKALAYFKSIEKDWSEHLPNNKEDQYICPLPPPHERLVVALFIA